MNYCGISMKKKPEGNEKTITSISTDKYGSKYEENYVCTSMLPTFE